MGRQHFSQSFKEQAVQKALSGAGMKHRQEVAANLGIGYSTLNKWIGALSANNVSKAGSGERRPADWTAQERLQAIIQTDTFEETDLGAYCRSQGIYPHHIQQWKQELLDIMPAKEDQLKKIRAEKRQLKAENDQLKHELNRKEKALAEAAALLVLKKKAQTLWGEQEDDS